MKIRKTWLAAVAFLLSAGLATGASSGVIRHDRSDQDYLALGASFDSVGRVLGSTVDFNFSASATLIASDWVLTAGHVVDDATALSVIFDGISYDADQLIAHPKWNGNLGGGYDIALVLLTSAVAGIAPAARFTGTNELGQVATSVGFGMTGTGLTGAQVFDGQKRGGNNALDAVLLTPGKGNRVLLSDFDNPLNPADSSWGSVFPETMEFLIAPGSSGGGLFLEVDGAQLLAGVHSFGWGLLDGIADSTYGDAAGHTRVSSFNAWIDSVLAGGDGSSGGKGGPPKKANNGKDQSKFKVKPLPTFNVASNSVQVFVVPPPSIPEPTSLALFGVGLVALGALLWRRRRAQPHAA